MPRPLKFSLWLLLCLPILATSYLTPTNAEDNSVTSTIPVYIGTYTPKGGEGSKGIYRVMFDTQTGKLGKPELVAETNNPSWLTLHPNKKYLYAVNETSEGHISAFRIDAKSGKLTFLNQQSAGGGAPCHMVIDKSGKTLLAANYTGGNIASFPISADGKLGEAASLMQHKGSSVTPRQKAPHAHSINLDAANQFAIAADLGLDKLMVYRFDATNSKLSPADPPSASLPPGSGPRHFVFHADGKHAYAINELTSTITALTYDAAKGVLTPQKTISTLPKGFKGNNSTAEVQIHPNGKFLYGSNRGHNSIVAFRIDPTTAQQTYIAHEGTDIDTPRNFGIDPRGNFILVGNQAAGSIVVFRIDQETGKLTPTGIKAEIPMPICIRYFPS
jgi:6-phosphogluconolactonase